MAKTAESEITSEPAAVNEPKKFERRRIRVRISTREFEEGVDFAFNYQSPSIFKNGKLVHAYPVELYHLVNGREYDLPVDLVEHLENIETPVKKYVEGAEEGNSIQDAGTVHRFQVSRLG